jgi:hypothetical protein
MTRQGAAHDGRSVAASVPKPASMTESPVTMPLTAAPETAGVSLIVLLARSAVGYFPTRSVRDRMFRTEDLVAGLQRASRVSGPKDSSDGTPTASAGRHIENLR